MKKLFLIALAVLAMPLVCVADEAAPDAPKEPAAQQKRGDFTIFRFDANKDGVVTKDELPADAKRLADVFDRIDADKDGKVTKAEEDTFKAEMQKRIEARKAAAKEPAAQQKRGNFTIFRFDANKDGVVTKDELPAEAKRLANLFDRIDADKDGKVTKAEEDTFKAEVQKRNEAK